MPIIDEKETEQENEQVVFDVNNIDNELVRGALIKKIEECCLEEEKQQVISYGEVELSNKPKEEEEEEEKKGDEEEKANESNVCSHFSAKHIKAAKCLQNLKKNITVDHQTIICLQCGVICDSDVGVKSHFKKARHPLQFLCGSKEIKCFKCQIECATNPNPAIEFELTTIKKSLTLKETLKSKTKKQDLVLVPSSTTTIAAAAAPRGLKNLGNTCFFNSVVQCLAQCLNLTSFLEQNKNQLGPLASNLRRCLEDVNLSSQSKAISKAVSPASLFSAVCKVAPHFSGFEQQDAQELLTFLFSGLDDEAALDRKREETKLIETQPKGKKFAIKGLEWKHKNDSFFFREDQQVLERVLPLEDEDDERLYDFQPPYGEDEHLKNPNNETEQQPPSNQQQQQTELVNPVKELFLANFDSVVTCEDCQSSSSTKESLYMVNLALESASALLVSLCLDNFLQGEKLSTADGNGFQCKVCAKRSHKKEDEESHDALRVFRLNGVGDVLILHFKRFQQSTTFASATHSSSNGQGKGKKNKKSGGGMGGATKIEKDVEIQSQIDLQEHGKYQFFGLVEHLGRSLYGGHYIAYVKSGTCYYRISDENVTLVNEAQVLNNTQAYLLFYERR